MRGVTVGPAATHVTTTNRIPDRPEKNRAHLRYRWRLMVMRKNVSSYSSIGRGLVRFPYCRISAHMTPRGQGGTATQLAGSPQAAPAALLHAGNRAISPPDRRVAWAN